MHTLILLAWAIGCLPEVEKKNVKTRQNMDENREVSEKQRVNENHVDVRNENHVGCNVSSKVEGWHTCFYAFNCVKCDDAVIMFHAHVLYRVFVIQYHYFIHKNHASIRPILCKHIELTRAQIRAGGRAQAHFGSKCSESKQKALWFGLENQAL